MAPGCGRALVNTQGPEQAVLRDSAAVWGTRSFKSGSQKVEVCEQGVALRV